MLHELSHFVPLSRSLNNRLFKGECNTCTTISFVLRHSIVNMGVYVEAAVTISRKNVVIVLTLGPTLSNVRFSLEIGFDKADVESIA